MLRALTFALAMLAAATPSSANVLVFDDLSGFYEFDKKSLTVLQDLDDAAKSALTPNSTLTSDCLNNLFQNLELTKSGVAVVEALASLDINMASDPSWESSLFSGKPLIEQWVSRRAALAWSR